ncbi:MAG: PAS domain S-box protein [Pirellulaceae bacterium]
MLEPNSPQSFWLWRLSITVLAALCLGSFALSAWLTTDFRHEQIIIEKITKHLPASDLPDVRELAQDLQLQSRLTLLLVINLFGSAIALGLLVRAYFTSERHLRKVRIQAEDILVSLDQGVITAEQNGVLLNVNPKARDLLGVNETMPTTLDSLAAQHAHLDQMRNRIVAGEAVLEQEYCVEREHHIRYLRAGCSVLRDHDKNPAGVVIHLRDVTEKTLMQQRLLRMERYMGLGSLAAGLQHEIKTR